MFGQDEVREHMFYVMFLGVRKMYEHELGLREHVLWCVRSCPNMPRSGSTLMKFESGYGGHIFGYDRDLRVHVLCCVRYCPDRVA